MHYMIWEEGNIADYFSIPVESTSISISKMSIINCHDCPKEFTDYASLDKHEKKCPKMLAIHGKESSDSESDEDVN